MRPQHEQLPEAVVAPDVARSGTGMELGELRKDHDLVGEPNVVADGAAGEARQHVVGELNLAVRPDGGVGERLVGDAGSGVLADDGHQPDAAVGLERRIVDVRRSFELVHPGE